MIKKVRLEELIRKYQNYKGWYIPKEQHIKELEGCFYVPVLGTMQPVGLAQQNRLRRLINWALG